MTFANVFWVVMTARGREAQKSHALMSLGLNANLKHKMFVGIYHSHPSYFNSCRLSAPHLLILP